MNRSENQQVIDEIIGEAALMLLQRAGPINSQALIEQLKVMQAQATEDSHRAAIAAAIGEVRASISAGNKARDKKPEGDNVHQLFQRAESPGSSRKH